MEMANAPLDGASAPLASAPPQENLPVAPTEREQGQCRICLEYGGTDLIAPCICKGTTKWVHRHCLDHWRARGQGARAFTHCPQCNYAYLMRLVRDPSETQQQLRDRRRRFLRHAVGNFFLGVLLLQLLLCTVAILIRLVDRDETLVDVIPFFSPKLPGEENGSVMQAFRYHKSTYYFASVLFCLAMTGLSVIIYYTVKLCASCCKRRGDTRSTTSDWDCCDWCWYPTPYRSNVQVYYFPHIQCGCCDCGDCCDACCNENCCRGCPDMPSVNRGGGGGGSSGNSNNDGLGAIFGIICLVISAILVIVGLFFAMAALVTWIQKVVQRYVALKELQTLTGEYIVADLALLEEEQRQKNQADQMPWRSLWAEDLEQAPSAPEWVPMMPQQVQVNLYRDLQAVYGYQAV